MISFLMRNFIPHKLNFITTYCLSTTSVCCNENERLPNQTYKVNNFEKRLLVWMGKYKNVADVPLYIAPDVMEKTRSWTRIRISNITIVLTLVGCAFMIYSGKQARNRGESLSKQNVEWHKEYNERENKAQK